ncbi:MAG: hypothetical protein Q9195_008284 [Heterodermia aff. obscurata]
MGSLNAFLSRTLFTTLLTLTLLNLHPITTTAYTLRSFFARNPSPSPSPSLPPSEDPSLFSLAPPSSLSIFFSEPTPDPILTSRDTTPTWYHRAETSPLFRQWTFGTATQSYNLSSSTCLHLSDHIGIYTLANGTTLTNATLHQILTDLLPPTPSSPSARKPPASVHYAQRLLQNAQLALQEAEQYLTTYALVPQDPSSTPATQSGARYYEELRRHLLVTPGTRTALILKVGVSTGIALGAQGYLQSASPNSTYAPYAAAGAAAGGIALTFALIDLLVQEGLLFAPFEEVVGATAIGRGLRAVESMIGSIFLAVFRRVMRLAVGSAERQRGRDPNAIAAGRDALPVSRYGAGVRGGGVGGGRGGSSRDPFGEDYPYSGGGSVVRTGGVAGGRGGRISDPFADDPFGAGGDAYGIGGGSVGYGGSGGVDYGRGGSSSRYDSFGGSSAYGGGGFGSGSGFGGGGAGFGGFGGGGGFGQGSRGTSYGGEVDEDAGGDCGEGCAVFE